MSSKKDRDFTSYWRYLTNELDINDLKPDQEEVVTLNKINEYIQKYEEKRPNLAVDLMIRIKALSACYSSNVIISMVDTVLESRRVIERDYGDDSSDLISLLASLYVYAGKEMKMEDVWKRDITKQ